MAYPPTEVFLCSTCYDLIDLREELAAHLEGCKFIVYRSEDPRSAFRVDPTDDSIESCLRNVERANVVVCIIDRRYGEVLKNGEYAGMSATHVEVRHALKCGKPILYFIRKHAETEYHQMRRNRDYQAQWVEERNPDRCILWFSFVDKLFTLPEHAARSNWYDSFSTSVDLKPLVLKRLADLFPGHAGVVAADPDRVVRLTYRHSDYTLSPDMLYFVLDGAIENLGVGPAYMVRAGVAQGDNASLAVTVPGVPEGSPRTAVIKVPIAPDYQGQAIVLEYRNRFNDWYRTVIPFTLDERGKPTLVKSGTLLLARTGPESDPQWVRID